MTEWEMTGVIIVLIGLVASIVKPILSLNSNIVKLNTTLDALTSRNEDEHDTINVRLKEHGCQLDNHEGRIIWLETHQEGAA